MTAWNVNNNNYSLLLCNYYEDVHTVILCDLLTTTNNKKTFFQDFPVILKQKFQDELKNLEENISLVHDVMSQASSRSNK